MSWTLWRAVHPPTLFVQGDATYFWLILMTCLCLTTTQAEAFDLDGLFSGMTKAQALQKLQGQGLEPKPGMFGNDIVAGVYSIGFCNNDRIAAVSKTVDFREFNAYFVDMLVNHGNPKVDIPSPDQDILYLRWTTNAGFVSLNSGTTDGRRFHNISEIDNTFCHK